MYNSNFSNKDIIEKIVNENKIECNNYCNEEIKIRNSLIYQNIELKKRVF